MVFEDFDRRRIANLARRMEFTRERIAKPPRVARSPEHILARIPRTPRVARSPEQILSSRVESELSPINRAATLESDEPLDFRQLNKNQIGDKVGDEKGNLHCR